MHKHLSLLTLLLALFIIPGCCWCKKKEPKKAPKPKAAKKVKMKTASLSDLYDDFADDKITEEELRFAESEDDEITEEELRLAEAELDALTDEELMLAMADEEVTEEETVPPMKF